MMLVVRALLLVRNINMFLMENWNLQLNVYFKIILLQISGDTLHSVWPRLFCLICLWGLSAIVQILLFTYFIPFILHQLGYRTSFLLYMMLGCLSPWSYIWFFLAEAAYYAKFGFDFIEKSNQIGPLFHNIALQQYILLCAQVIKEHLISCLAGFVENFLL